MAVEASFFCGGGVEFDAGDLTVFLGGEVLAHETGGTAEFEEAGVWRHKRSRETVDVGGFETVGIEFSSIGVFD